MTISNKGLLNDLNCIVEYTKSNSEKVKTNDEQLVSCTTNKL